DDAIDARMRLLHLDEALDRAEIVAEVQIAGRLNAGKHALGKLRHVFRLGSEPEGRPLWQCGGSRARGRSLPARAFRRRTPIGRAERSGASRERRRAAAWFPFG